MRLLNGGSFRPERWEDGSLQDRIGWGYLPFNGGPRICLGREYQVFACTTVKLTFLPSEEFALLEASYATARILQAFPDAALPSDEKVVPIGHEPQNITLTLAPTEGCRVKLYE